MFTYAFVGQYVRDFLLAEADAWIEEQWEAMRQRMREELVETPTTPSSCPEPPDATPTPP